MRRTLRRKVALGAGAAVAVAVPLAIAWPTLAATEHAPVVQTRAARAASVTSASQLSTAVAQAQPGDRITVADGVYRSPIRVTRSGTASAPIVISAQNVGRAEVTADNAFQLAGVSNVVIEGFTFNQNAGLDVPPSAKAIRVTRNTFQSGKAGSYLNVSADNAEVDHNTFQNKKNAGVYLQVNGPGAHDMAKNVRIHHNYFFNHQFKGANGGESIRLGLSGRQHGQARALVEFNLFEKADGDSEALSVKSSNNIIRHNTFRDSRGTLSLRHGSGTLVDGNFILGGTSGIRFFGNNHTVINNVVQGSAGQALEVGGGEVRDDKDSGRNHEAADHCVVAFNTLQSNRAGMVVYGNKPFPPSDITLADNILVGTGTLIRPNKATGLTFQGNLISGGSAGVSGGGFRTANPQLVTGAGGLLRLKAGSPAIDAGSGSFPQVAKDMDGQTRAGGKDVGADELGGSGERRPLTAADVGPKAP